MVLTGNPPTIYNKKTRLSIDDCPIKLAAKLIAITNCKEYNQDCAKMQRTKLKGKPVNEQK